MHAESEHAGLRWTENASLRSLNSFGLESRAEVLAIASSVAAIELSLARARRLRLPVQILGGGSNILLAGDVAGVVLVPALRGVEWQGQAADSRRVRVAAGENWHAFVDLSLGESAFGLENLGLIPGSVGAAPIQNIGAYGVEVEEFIHAVEVFDRTNQQVVWLSREQCDFAYRDSIFKREPERYIVLQVEFSLRTTAAPVLGYAGIREELAAHASQSPTPRDVFDAVCAIRRRKLPDPSVIGNAGSFFKNPIVPSAQAAALVHAYPRLPVYAMAQETSKLSAAWLIEACGWKGHRVGDAGVHSAHALVLVNHGSARGSEILALAKDIQASVLHRFGVDLEPEPRVI